MNGIFSTRGRLNRLRYFGISLTIWTGFVSIVLIISLPDEPPIKESYTFIFFILLVGSVLRLIQAAKRFHDLGLHGINSWMLFVPIVSIYWELALLFKKGTEGSNQYGLDPLQSIDFGDPDIHSEDIIDTIAVPNEVQNYPLSQIIFTKDRIVFTLPNPYYEEQKTTMMKNSISVYELDDRYRIEGEDSKNKL